MSMNDTDELARIGARVKAYRTKQNMTQQELAVRDDLSLQSGNANPDRTEDSRGFASIP